MRVQIRGSLARAWSFQIRYYITPNCGLHRRLYNLSSWFLIGYSPRGIYARTSQVFWHVFGHYKPATIWHPIVDCTDDYTRQVGF